MKLKLFQLVIISTLILSQISCIDDKELIEKININNLEINSLKDEIRNIEFNEVEESEALNSEDEININNHDFCNTNKAIIEQTGKNWYNKKNGIAYFQIPIPKNSKLTRIKKTPTSIYYVCTGENYNGDVKLKRKIITGLSQKEQDTLKIHVAFILFDNDNCKNKKKFIGDKHKTSVIAGSDPIAPNKKIINAKIINYIFNNKL